nr:MAG TPA: hypothetical protein [Caudoviricetes sp.]
MISEDKQIAGLKYSDFSTSTTLITMKTWSTAYSQWQKSSIGA